MSTPSLEPQRRAAELAEFAANALHDARLKLSHAADATQELNTVLRRAEDEIYELPLQASKMEATGQARPFLQNAQYVADQIDRRLENGGHLVGEIRDRLDSATTGLQAGRQALEELSRLPVEHDRELMDRLSHRISDLNTAVNSAHDGLDRANTRIGRAQESLGGLIEHRSEPSPTFVRDTAADVDRDLMHTRTGVRELAEDLDGHDPNAAATAQDAELARAFHAGAYTTAKSAQRHQPAAADEAHKPAETEITSRLRGL
ncbi:hypothetical protein HPO96_20180 [Kribbella sandramycini]|uniref:Flagellar biosynthesis chaperone FliJ n=1 Tax=Kribbella sandramycini TaxID=60450 RepID=A0A7Y4L317_9ACTN|nr:hypothetical protein [Kribbella sandramycini]MBB6564870.1 flagellar biosynthesis chaperone FliJ [Kribbella sandramycini]NOL42567.1 hypothetical protein [Kribbella sandramycini]